MENAFGRTEPFTVGIEEEFQVVSAESYELVPRFDDVAEAANDDRVRQELMTSVLEAATGIHETVGDAIAEAREIRRLLCDAAVERNALIASAGTHPFSRWEHQEITQTPRYQGLVEELRWVAEQVAIFGLHVHIGMPDAETAVAVTNALRTYIPELLALSANSPFWQARQTGLASTRCVVFDGMPRTGLPPRFETFADFTELVTRGTAAGFYEDYTYIWWDVRPHPKLGTVELRSFDAQTRIENVAGLAALAQSLAATVAGVAAAPQPRALIAENRWRAARSGLDAELVDLADGRRRAGRDAIRELVELARPAAGRLGCTAELEEVERICERGSGADEQLRIHDDEGSLLAVARWVAAKTVEGLS